MTKIGIIGSGAIGSGLARLAVAAGHRVLVANSRGPESLTELVDDLGDGASAGTVDEAAEFGDLTILSVPLTAYADLPSEKLAGRVVLSTGNYYPSRDGRIEELDSLELTTAEYERKLLPGAVIVKAFNNILAHHIPRLARTAGSPDRSALATYGDDADAKAKVGAIIDDFGFDPIDAGALADSWRTEPESGAYTQIYVADLEVFHADYLADQGRPLSADRLREVLAESTRAAVSERQF
ncbi:NADPH-dependent F420 reductase [uncultured Corynebacterium sp.]|uniref:NADPH-dependent F420 reductase n=1 Tax=uncultured Corynebacterium sp. TaxID=159447 RepID=UPI0025EC8383|nr:NAD(P)-binding domain-containing protein [uncultured Corynebacterium sp.]